MGSLRTRYLERDHPELNLAAHFFAKTNFFSEIKTYLDQYYEIAANCSGIDPIFLPYLFFPNHTNGCNTNDIPQAYLIVYKPGMQFNYHDIFTDLRATNGMDDNLQAYLSICIHVDFFPQCPEVQKALHISSARNTTAGVSGWAEWNAQAVDALGLDSLGSQQLLPKIIESGIATLLYEEMVDFTLHYKGVEAMIDNTTWNGATGSQRPHVADLHPAPFPGSRKYNHTVAGKITSERGLTYITVIDAGHEIPMYPLFLATNQTYAPGTGVNFDLAKIDQPLNVPDFVLPPGGVPFPGSTSTTTTLRY
ncbi:hypothetical protein BDK51DRAFT_52012 [Blyttiomyces helicus]|uniref:Uncharacterized protein n=1 Tax=Blyttiomyces helicus TaxID=388810 RepID=A0A4P9WAG1_9FUNG|nr:hypothetical protein BDK51DRAFT_52012 [Blyttiomyces helicus]|eukprot:RKO87226.1 hypothetical protein BDK51DRAFT_52012 [Blyttiomyces helicus]